MKILKLLFVVMLAPACYANTPGSDAFHLGVAAFQKNEFSEASKGFSETIEHTPNSAPALYNWGLSQYKENNIGYALAAWRRSRTISPSFSLNHKAIDYVQKHHATSNAERNNWESYRQYFLAHLSIHWVIGTTLVLLFAGGLYLLKFLAARKFAFLQEAPIPSAPMLPIIVLMFGILSLIISTSKIYDLLESRATVIAKNTAVYSGPSSEDNKLFELLEGAEVLPLLDKGLWLQIQSIGGLSGWIKSESIYYTSGKKIW